MKILHIINTLAIGGAQSVLYQLIEQWGDPGDYQMVISLRKPEQLSARIEALGVPVKHINMQPGEVNFAKFLNLIHIIRAYQPDVVQTWLYHADLIGSFASLFAGGAPIVWGVHHSTASLRSLKPATANVVRILSALSHWIPKCIVCCSDSALQTHLELGYAKEKIVAIWNGVDTIRFRPDPSAHDQLIHELRLEPRDKLIGMFARFHPQKDHRNLIRAAGFLVQDSPNVHFVLAGDGVDELNLQLMDWIEEAGIRNNVHLLGKRQDMSRLIAGMDIITLTSSHGEALPQVLGEAMACGVPCVATNVGDTAKLIGNTGSIVEPEDLQALMNAWTRILNLPDTEYNELCKRARNRVQRFYNTIGMVDEYKSIYRKIRIK